MSRERAGRAAAILIAAFAVALAASAATSPRREVAVFAGGCFWGMEDVLRRLPGVLDTEVGYTGGRTAEPNEAASTTSTEIPSAEESATPPHGDPTADAALPDEAGSADRDSDSDAGGADAGPDEPSPQ